MSIDFGYSNMVENNQEQRYLRIKYNVEYEKSDPIFGMYIVDSLW